MKKVKHWGFFFFCSNKLFYMFSTMNKVKSNMKRLESLLLEEGIAAEIDTAEIDFSKLCRTCLCETTDNDLGNESLCIINANGKLLRVYDMFEASTGLKIASNDTLPHRLCSACLKLVNSSYTFRTQSQRASAILQSLLGRVKEEAVDLNEDIQLVEDDPETIDPVEDIQLVELSEYVSSEEADVPEEELPEEYLPEEELQAEPPTTEPDEIESSRELNRNKEVSVEELSLDEMWMEDDIMIIEKLEDTSDADEEYLFSEPEDINQKVSGSTGRFACQFCTMVFSLQRDIIQHYKDDHPKEKPFKCGECSACFSHIQSMRRHKKTHQASSKEKMCALCSRMFHRSDDLKRHIRTHTHERPYSCSKCLKAFKQHTELKDHMLSHAEAKMYKCVPCAKEWRSRNGWYLHMKVHREGSSAKRRKRIKKTNAKTDDIFEADEINVSNLVAVT